MLAGTFRRGSGMIGSGGVAEVAPVVIGALCGSDALIWMLPLRAFGAGFGTGTICAEPGATSQVANSKASPLRIAPTANGTGIRIFGLLFNANSFSTIMHFLPD